MGCNLTPRILVTVENVMDQLMVLFIKQQIIRKLLAVKFDNSLQKGRKNFI